MKASEIKKGMKIVEYGAWNFNKGMDRTMGQDKYFTTNWIVYSCGKSQMKLQDEEGMAQKIVHIMDGRFVWNGIALDMDGAIKGIQTMFEADEMSTRTYTVEEQRC
jgi:hypothetical protein